MKILINYATSEFAHSRRINSASAYIRGGIDKVVEYSLADLDPEFRRRNAHIFQHIDGAGWWVWNSGGGDLFRTYWNQHIKGAGWWVWKPYLIRKALEQMTEEDFLFYSDAGLFIKEPLDPLIEVMKQKNQDVLPLETFSQERRYLERHFTKRDAFVLMDCDNDFYLDRWQIWAGFSVWRKTAFSMRLADEWLLYAQDKRILTKIPNQCGENYPGFVGHRHDQSIFSLLCRKHQLEEYSGPPLVFRSRLEPHLYMGFCLRRPWELRLNWLIVRETVARNGWRKTARLFWSKLKRNIEKSIKKFLPRF